ncbi:MAG: malonate transporter subunit MadL [Proteobacteria bacterium]|nr:malonate transporter subunit MadL [Pseudomonadota bacterium]MCH8175136.1 malonate transporter subunit MadL [Pseudomonadota bacterium]
MIVYGVALLSVCLVLGMLFGEALGVLLNVEANVGGVGIAMLFLVFASNSDKFKALTEGVSGTGIKFWSAMYIPIVVAMAARQNVAAATEGGLLALSAGVAAVIVSFALVPVFSKLGKDDSPAPDTSEEQEAG